MSEYLIVIEEEDGKFGASVPDLPGCFAVGKTLEEVSGRIKSAIKFHVEGLRAEGKAVPEPKARAEYASA